MSDEKPWNKKNATKYEKIRLVTQQLGEWNFGKWDHEKHCQEFKVSFERDSLKIEGEGTDDLDGIISDRFKVTYEGENVYSNVMQENDPTAAIYKPGGEWERKLDEFYVEAQKDLEERIRKKLSKFKGFTF